jgi:hypothetical protein
MQTKQPIRRASKLYWMRERERERERERKRKSFQGNFTK